MLPILNRTASRLSTRARVCLAASAVVALASPLVYVSRTPIAQAEDAGPAAATTAPKSPPAEFFPPLTKSEEKILAELDKPTVVDFTETSLQAVMDFLQDHHGIEIQLDHKALDDAAVGSDTPITRHLRGTTLRSALRLMLDNLDLAFDVHDDVLQITTKERAEATLCTRTYPVEDLVEPSDYDVLVKAITRVVKPQTWDEVGGPATIIAMKGAKSLVVSQTRENHDEILAFLRSLRAARDASAARADLKKKK